MEVQIHLNVQFLPLNCLKPTTLSRGEPQPLSLLMYRLQLCDITYLINNIWILPLRIDGSDTGRLHLCLDVPLGDLAIFDVRCRAAWAVRSDVIRLRLIIELSYS